MLDRLEDGVRGAAAVPRRRRPRAADAAHRPAGAPRAARPRRPGGGRRDPRAAARRGRPDVPAGRRPDPAGQGRPPGLRTARPTDLAELTVVAVWPRRARSATATGCSTEERRGDVHLDEQRVTQACSSWPTTPSSTPARRPDRARARQRDGGRLLLWVRDSGPGVPADDRERIFERFGRGDVAAGRRGVRARAVDRAAIAEAHGGTVDVRDAAPRRARFELRLPTRAAGRTDGPHPDRRGRGAHRLVRRQGSARRGLHQPTSWPTGVRASTSRCPGSSTCGPRHRAARDGRLRGARRAARAGQPDAGDRAHRPRLGDRHRLRARGRRRRLHAQAVPLRRAAGPRPAAAAAGRGRARRPGARRRARGRRRPPRPAHPRATVGGRDVELSAREFKLAEIFMLNPGQVLSREQLLAHVWGYDFDPGSNVVDVYVGYLRASSAPTRSARFAAWATGSTPDLTACVEAGQPGRAGSALRAAGSRRVGDLVRRRGRSAGSRRRGRRRPTLRDLGGQPSGRRRRARRRSCG